jgi:hypothetical protein
VIRRIVKGYDADLLAMLAESAGLESQLAGLKPILDPSSG